MPLAEYLSPLAVTRVAFQEPHRGIIIHMFQKSWSLLYPTTTYLTAVALPKTINYQNLETYGDFVHFVAARSKEEV